MMKKLLFLVGILTISLFLIACTPAPESTDEELDAELAQLSDQQLESLQEGRQPLAGQAYASILQRTSRQRILDSVTRIRAGRIQLAIRLPLGANCSGSDWNMFFMGAESRCDSGFCLNYSINSFDNPDVTESLSSWGCPRPGPAPEYAQVLHCCAPMNVPEEGRCVPSGSGPIMCSSGNYCRDGICLR
ncbi:MAG: hypothetical protein Q7K45_00955 [Nanoarchaeota archaeon]|nr:hypothetical protein [Nanoarchaeota archaeon]